MKQECDKIGVVFLNCASWKHPKHPEIEFFGCTLWSLMSKRTWSQMNENKVFENHQNLLSLHLQHVQWLTESLKESKATQKYGITHYLPSFDLVHPRFASSTINDGFATNLNNILDNKNLNLKGWFYGHSHERVCKIIIGTLPSYNNPMGYPKEVRLTEISYDAIPFELGVLKETEDTPKKVKS